MPAPAPLIEKTLAARLVAVGERIRAHRQRQKVSATTAAESAGMSRVTLHRIERGEPSVTMGAYMNAIAALGLELDVRDPQDRQPVRASLPDLPDLPSNIRLDGYPQLKRLAWQLHGVEELTPAEALGLYERNWRHVDQVAMTAHERALVQGLVAKQGGSRLLV